MQRVHDPGTDPPQLLGFFRSGGLLKIKNDRRQHLEIFSQLDITKYAEQRRQVSRAQLFRHGRQIPRRGFSTTVNEGRLAYRQIGKEKRAFGE